MSARGPPKSNKQPHNVSVMPQPSQSSSDIQSPKTDLPLMNCRRLRTYQHSWHSAEDLHYHQLLTLSHCVQAHLCSAPLPHLSPSPGKYHNKITHKIHIVNHVMLYWITHDVIISATGVILHPQFFCWLVYLPDSMTKKVQYFHAKTLLKQEKINLNLGAVCIWI